MHFLILLILFFVCIFLIYFLIYSYFTIIKNILIAFFLIIFLIALYQNFPELTAAIVICSMILFLVYIFIENHKELNIKDNIENEKLFISNGGNFLIAKINDLYEYNHLLNVILKYELVKGKYIVTNNNLKIVFHLRSSNRISIQGKIEGIRINENFNKPITSFNQIKTKDEVGIIILTKILDEIIAILKEKLQLFLDRDFNTLSNDEIIVYDSNSKRHYKAIFNIDYLNNKNFKLTTDNKDYSIRLAEYELKNSDNVFYIKFNHVKKTVIAHQNMSKGKAIIEIRYEKWIEYRKNNQIIFKN